MFRPVHRGQQKEVSFIVFQSAVSMQLPMLPTLVSGVGVGPHFAEFRWHSAHFVSMIAHCKLTKTLAIFCWPDQSSRLAITLRKDITGAKSLYELSERNLDHFRRLTNVFNNDASRLGAHGIYDYLTSLQGYCTLAAGMNKSIQVCQGPLKSIQTICKL